MSVDFKNVRGLLESFELDDGEIEKINQLLAPVLDELGGDQKTEILNTIKDHKAEGNGDHGELIDFFDDNFSKESLVLLQEAITKNPELINYLQNLILDKMI